MTVKLIVQAEVKGKAQVDKLKSGLNSLGTQVWKVRIGRSAGTFPLIYLNRNSQNATPYAGAASSWIAITEIDN
mgnify:CR=1 FL=1